MNTLRLKGKTQKGKNRVKELGEFWEIVRVIDSAICCNNLPAFEIKPKNNFKDKERIVQQENDPDFILEKI